jgi:hypothetical protein
MRFLHYGFHTVANRNLASSSRVLSVHILALFKKIKYVRTACSIDCVQLRSMLSSKHLYKISVNRVEPQHEREQSFLCLKRRTTHQCSRNFNTTFLVMYNYRQLWMTPSLTEKMSSSRCCRIRMVLNIYLPETDKGDVLGEPAQRRTCTPLRTYVSVNHSGPNLQLFLNR